MLDGPSVVAALRDCGVSHVVWLPDTELGAWEAALTGPQGLPLIRVCREGEAFAVAAGLRLGGKKPVILIQCTGFFEAGDALRNAAVLVSPQRLPNPKLVGKPASFLAEQAGFSIPPKTRALIAELRGVGRDYPLSIEKLCPVLSYYVVADWHEGCERCIQILRYGGMGHTMSIHSRNEEVILEFGLKKPAYRIVVNTPTTHGSIGLTTGLDPAMTLGCGGFGGNITSDNISPRHLLNIKRLAYETRPAVIRVEGQPASSAKNTPAEESRLPKVASPPASAGIDAPSMRRQMDAFLGSAGTSPSASPDTGAVVPFVCEEDVKQAIKIGRKIVIGERTIVTPAARDLAQAHRIFVTATWPQT